MPHYVGKALLAKIKKYVPVKVEARDLDHAKQLLRFKGYTVIARLVEIKPKKELDTNS